MAFKTSTSSQDEFFDSDNYTYTFGKQDIRVNGVPSLTQIAETFTNTPASSTRYGAGVAISQGRIFVTQPEVNSDEGALYIFDLDGNELAYLDEIAALGANDQFGENQAIAAAGGKIAIGYEFDDLTTGDVWVGNIGEVGTHGGDTTNELALEMVLTGASNEDWGSTLAISNNRIVVGAPTRSTRGAFYIYDTNSNSQDVSIYLDVEPFLSDLNWYDGYTLGRSSRTGGIRIPAIGAGYGLFAYTTYRQTVQIDQQVGNRYTNRVFLNIHCIYTGRLLYSKLVFTSSASQSNLGSRVPNIEIKNGKIILIERTSEEIIICDLTGEVEKSFSPNNFETPLAMAVAGNKIFTWETQGSNYALKMYNFNGDLISSSTGHTKSSQHGNMAAGNGRVIVGHDSLNAVSIFKYPETYSDYIEDVLEGYAI
jgi:hypothetical protein